MIPFMVSWLMVVQATATAAVLHGCYRYRAERLEHSAAIRFVATAIPSVLMSVPTIYTFGWLFLPAWGIGAIPFGG